MQQSQRRAKSYAKSQSNRASQRAYRLGVTHGHSYQTKQNPNLSNPRDLNEAIKREYYPMPTIEEVASRLPEAAVFSTLDATSGYWQIPVDEESSKLLTFNSPYGRFRFKRLPFGISPASEVFQRTMNDLFGDIEGCEII